jgi:hypothetical protein
MATVDHKTQQVTEGDHSPAELSAGSKPFSRFWLILFAVAAFLLVLFAVGIYAHFQFGAGGLLVCLFVWMIIVSASIAAHFASAFFSGPEMLQSQMLAGMGVRTGVALVLALVITQAVPAWENVGAIQYLVAFYFVGLVVDVVLALKSFVPAVNSGTQCDREL